MKICFAGDFWKNTEDNGTIEPVIKEKLQWVEVCQKMAVCFNQLKISLWWGLGGWSLCERDPPQYVKTVKAIGRDLPPPRDSSVWKGNSSL